MKVTFLHPDLGLGGAERLVIDAALELQDRGHEVEIVTMHHDPSRAFPETSDGSLRVRVHASRSRTFFGDRARAVQAIVGMRSMARAVTREPQQPDVYICDLVAHAIPLVRKNSSAKVIFYCHFPDRYLAPQKRNLAYRIYRAPIERMEAAGLRAADRVLVNSRFTESKFHEAFPQLQDIEPTVVYPGVPVTEATGPSSERADRQRFTLLSLNRFDPSKNLQLAIGMMSALRDRLEPEMYDRTQLVMAGALDERLAEQSNVYQDLQEKVRESRLEAHIEFRTSISDSERNQLLREAACFVYTPPFEHFGIGPIEAMLAGTPVVAANTGGVQETVVDGETGTLCPATPQAFAEAVALLILDPPRRARMAEAAIRHARESFSRSRFGDQLDEIVTALR